FAFSRNFLTGDGASWDVRVGELNSTPALGYRYDGDDSPFAADVAMPVGDLVTEKLRAYRRAVAGGLLGSTPGVRRIDIASLGSTSAASTDNSPVGTREKPLGVNVPLHRSLSEMLGPEARLGPVAGETEARRDRRYVFAFMHDIELPLDPTTRVQ